MMEVVHSARYTSLAKLISETLGIRRIPKTDVGLWVKEPIILLTPLQSVYGLSVNHQKVSYFGSLEKDKQLLVLSKLTKTVLHAPPSNYIVVNGGHHHRGSAMRVLEVDALSILEWPMAAPLVERQKELRLITVKKRPATGYFRWRDDMNQFVPWNASFDGVSVSIADQDTLALAWERAKKVLEILPFDVAGFDFLISNGELYLTEVNMSPGLLTGRQEVHALVKAYVEDAILDAWGGDLNA